MPNWLIVIAFFCFCYAPNCVQATEALIIYAPSAFSAEWGAGPAIQKAFETQYQHPIRWVVFSGATAMLNRLKIEGASSPADVVLGLDNHLLRLAQESGLLTPPNDSSTTLTLPGGWSEPLCIPYGYSYLTFIYNHQRVKNPPKSLRELVEGPDHWKLLYADPRSSSLGLQFLHWITHCYGAAVNTAWRRLAAKTVTVTPDWSSAYGLFMKGEADFMLGYNSSLAYHNQQQANHPYRATILAEGHPLQIEVAAKLASSRQPELADRFIQFMLTPTVQRLLVERHWIYPVIDIPLPAAFDNLTTPPLLPISRAEYTSDNQQQWIQLWRRASTSG
ncbi:MAG: thiamine ABC transporter substrate binding subunit [Candidatus Symbiodolus clandestinus]